MDAITNEIKQLNMLIATSSWKEAQQKKEEIISLFPDSRSISYLLVKYKSANISILFKNIKKFTEEDFDIIEYELSNSKSNNAEEIFESLYGCYNKVSLELFSKLLELSTKYTYKEKDKKIKKIIDYSIKKSDFDLFKLAISYCKDSDEKKRKYISKFSDNTTNHEEKNECINISLSFGGDENEVARKNLFHEIKKGTDFLQMKKAYDIYLSKKENKNLEIEEILNFIANKVDTLAQIKLAKSIICEYTQDKNALKESIMKIATRALGFAYFEESKVLYEILIDIDMECADAYLGVCLSKAKISDVTEIFKSKYQICETEEYKKYIFLVNESERKVMKSIINLKNSASDVNKIEKVEEEINQCYKDVEEIEKYIHGRPTVIAIFLVMMTAMLFFGGIIATIYATITSSCVEIAAILGIGYAILTPLIICFSYGPKFLLSLFELPVYKPNQNDTGVFYWLFFPLIMLFWVVKSVIMLLICWIMLLVMLLTAKKRKQNIKNKFGEEAVLNPEMQKEKVENKAESLSKKLKQLKNTKRQLEQAEKLLYKSSSYLFKTLISPYKSMERYQNESIYDRAKSLLIGNKTEEYIEAERLFNTIVEFSDSKELAQYAREKIKAKS